MFNRKWKLDKPEEEIMRTILGIALTIIALVHIGLFVLAFVFALSVAFLGAGIAVVLHLPYRWWQRRKTSTA